MHVAARARLVLARRPWLYWLAVAVLAATVATHVHGASARSEEARQRWGATRSVLVASADLAPDGPIEVERRDLPVAALPARPLTDLPPGARLRQRVGAGEVLTEHDLVVAAGPAARAPAGTVVVGLSDPLSPDATVGSTVRVVAEGIVLAATATIVDVGDALVYVAVAADDGPTVAAAAQQGIASLLHVP
jgi:hypothetical protein